MYLICYASLESSFPDEVFIHTHNDQRRQTTAAGDAIYKKRKYYIDILY